MFKPLMKTFLCLFMLMFMSAVPAETASVETEKALTRLDDIIPKRTAYIKNSERQVALLEKSLDLSDSYESTFERYHQLAELYIYLNSDKALYYSNKEYECGQKMSNRVKAYRGIIDKAYAYTLQGDFDMAVREKNKVGDIRKLQKEDQGYLAFVNLLLADNRLAPNDKRRGQIWAEYSPYVPKTDHKYEITQARFLKKYDEHRLLSFVADPHTPDYMKDELYTVIADMYISRHNTDKATYYLALAAYNSITGCSLRNVAFIKLLDMPEVRADQNRSEAYVKVCMDNALQYNDKGNALKIMAKYREIVEDKEIPAHSYWMWIALAVAVVAAVIFFLLLRRIRRYRNEAPKPVLVDSKGEDRCLLDSFQLTCRILSSHSLS